MYAYISGKKVQATSNSVIIEAGGIGYEIFVSTNTIAKIVSDEAKLYTYFSVKEDHHTLYGFFTPQEKDMFIKLISVSGIGPKVGMSILSALSVSALVTAIISSDISAFEQASGVGKKTAQRIILELKEKVTSDSAISQPSEGEVLENSVHIEAINALVALGYDHTTASSAVSKVINLGDTTEQLILLALKRLG